MTMFFTPPGARSRHTAPQRMNCRSLTGRASARLAVALLGVLALVAVVGCGSSKPAYCSDRSALENAVKGLTSLNASSGLSGLKSQVKKIESDANAVVKSAKTDFPSQTSAIKSSVDRLKSAVKALAANPSPAQIAQTASSARNVVSSVKSFTDASKSKCS